MSVRAARGFQAFVFLLFSLIGLSLAGPALAAGEARSIVTTENSDYFGFDLRAEQNFSLDQCKTTCLGDPSCRAFTYNTKAKWCFLKSDYNQLKPFSGAVAGKVVNLTGEPDIGAPPELSFVPVLDGRRSPPLSPEPDRRLGQAGRIGPRRARRCRRAGGSDRRPQRRDAELHRGRDRSRRTTARCGRRSPRPTWPRSRPMAARPALFQRNAIVGGLERLPAFAHHQCARRRAARRSRSGSIAATISGRRCRPTRRAWRW